MVLHQEVPGLILETAIGEKSSYTVGEGTLPNVFLDNDHLLYLDYEHDMLKDMIAALDSEYIMYTKLRRTNSIKVKTLTLQETKTAQLLRNRATYQYVQS